MRLALKLVLAFILANVTLAGFYGYLAVRREVILFQKRAAAEAEEMGPVIEKLLTDACGMRGRSRHGGVVPQDHRRSEHPTRIRWVWSRANAEAEFCPAAAAERLTSIVIQEHVALEADEPDGISASAHVLAGGIDCPASRRGGIHPSKTELEANKQEIIRHSVLIGGMLLISGLSAVLLGVRLVGRPLEQLIAKARRIGQGDGKPGTPSLAR